jgi:hypothetical protein
MIRGLNGRGGLFSESRNTSFLCSSNAPKAVIRGSSAGREGHLRASGHLLGLCWVEFQDQAAVPWNEAGLCGTLKRDPHGPFCLIFEALNCYSLVCIAASG